MSDLRCNKISNQKIKRLAIIDPIILTPIQWTTLANLTNWINYFIRSEENNSRNEQESIGLTNLSKINKSNDEQMRNFLRDCDAIISCWTSITDDLILSNPNLRYIGYWTHCIDGKINIKLAEKKGITVTYIPDYATNAVAEMTILGILMIARRIIKNIKNTLKGNWPYEYLKTGTYIPNFEEIPASTLSGRLIGIVGFGRVGQRVAEIAQTFKMHVQYYSTSRHLDWESKGVRYVELNELFSSSEFISIHLPSNASDKIINKELIARMKDGGAFINTSIGRVVDEDALFDELKTGRIYAYLDVYRNLPNRKVLNELSTLNNLFTYRAAWFNKDSIYIKGEMLIRSIKNYLNFGKEDFCVETPKIY